MSNTVFLIALACMSAITFVLRAAPTLLPRKLLESPWLNALNFALPLSVMMVLILAALPLQAAFAHQNVCRNDALRWLQNSPRSW